MSGIAGYLGHAQELSVLQTMVRKLNHRGPDAEGFHIEAPVYMGVRRLATIDPSENWLPFYSEDRKHAIVFAGELYNHNEQRKKLEARGHEFRTQTDTEVVLKLYQTLGPNCVNQMRGVFVFAIHDMQKDLVFMARDQLGVQPLYYTTTQSGSFVFASEIKSLLEHPAVRMMPDMVGVDAFLSLHYSPGTAGMFKGIHSLPPGHRLIWNHGLHVMIEPYWQWETFAAPDPVLKTDADFQERFDELLEDSVHLRQFDDVPYGAFAGADLESAAILHIMSKKSTRPLRVFSAPFDVSRDGVPPVSEIAGRVGAMHEEVEFLPEYMDRLPELIWALDEPVAEPEILLSSLMARAAGQNLKAVVAGTGADALFANYPLHDTLLAANKMPISLYGVMREFKSLLPVSMLARKIGTRGNIGQRTRQKLFDFAEAVRGGSLYQQHMCLAAVFDSRDKQEISVGALAQVAGTFADQQKNPAGWPTLMASMVAHQREHFLPDGVLTPFNKMTMANGVACRLPFADPKMAEFMLGVPDHLRRGGKGRKTLLRNYVDRVMPGLAGQPAKPHELPQHKNLLETCLGTNPLREMVETCLSEASIKRRGMFDYAAVRRIMAGAKAGEALFMRQVFSLLVLELWFRIFVDHEKGWISK
ncbi:MAG: asparagine synthase (glutamine-hydrolyzing) [Micavibrio sp.]|nr:asparagine synthase (glutamine-hydrolyzing) [Micavibrio sp.]